MTQNENNPSIVCLMGPTATGKTELALSIAEKVPVEIVSVDSAMVYRGMDIGTAKPSPDILKSVPHHLVDIADPADPYSAGRFLRDAERTIREIHGRGRLPLLVGGTMLYFRVLRQGLAELPGADPELRSWLNAQAERFGWPALHERLQAVDPMAASAIAPTDSQRIQRALEVHQLTGEPLSSQRSRQQGNAPGFSATTIALWPEDRGVLAQRINGRFEKMIREGFLDEVRLLYERRDLSAETPAMRCVGYRQLWSYLAGDIDLDAATRAAQVATRRLAKRQFTWMRREAIDLRLDPFDKSLVERVLAVVESGSYGA